MEGQSLSLSILLKLTGTPRSQVQYTSTSTRSALLLRTNVITLYLFAVPYFSLAPNILSSSNQF